MSRFKNNRKIFIGVLVLCVFCASAVLAYAYENGNGYNPVSSLNTIQINQVVFDADKNNSLSDSNSSSESKLWERDANASDTEKASNESQSNYLFDGNTANNSETINISDNSGITSNNGSDSVYDITNDKTKADIIITDGETKKDTTDITKPGSDSNNSDTNRTSTIRDPDVPKGNPIILPGIDNKKYNESEVINNATSLMVYIQKALDASYSIYKGQIIHSMKEVFNYLDTYVTIRDKLNGNNVVRHLWTEDAYDRYIRIEGISFDGGITYISNVPVTIPKDIEKIFIKTSYRLSESDEWSETIVDYTLAESKLYILNKKLNQDATVIDESTVLNSGSFEYYPAEYVYNLYEIQNRLYGVYGYDEIKQLFTGWTENGKRVPWFYKVTEGRHILEPDEFIDVDEKYKLSLINKIVDDDFNEVMWGMGNGNYVYLQALSKYDTDGKTDDFGRPYVETLDVPKYVQAIEMNSWDGLSADYIRVPDTVLLISGLGYVLNVNKGWIVDENNPKYSSAAGLLLNKEQTEIMDIPSLMRKITIKDGIESVTINPGNSLNEITLQEEDVDLIPDITYSNLNDCEVLVYDSVLEDYIERNYIAIAEGNNVTIGTIENPNVTYSMSYGTIISSQGDLRKAFNNGSSIVISSAVKNIMPGAFEDARDITQIQMPKNGNLVNVEQDAFKNSSINTILCYTEEQYDSLINQKDKFGKEDINIQLLIQKNGYAYTVEENDNPFGPEQKVTLISAPDDMEVFNGIIDDGSEYGLKVTNIADNAFAYNTNLKYVILPEETTDIGYRAFYNCTNLEGVLINAEWQVIFGYESFDNCLNLRFLASNAMWAEMVNGYEPNNSKTDYWCPTYSSGYSGQFFHFTEQTGISSYEVIDIGDKGKALYGTSPSDYGTNPWLLINTGKTVGNRVTLPSSTVEIFTYAFQNTVTENGQYYEINWAELVNLEYIDGGAFMNSSLGKDISINKNVILGDNVFNGCGYMESFSMASDESFTIESGLFQNCTNLKSVKFGKVSVIYTGAFYGSNKLETIEISSDLIPSLTLYSSGSAFDFNSDLGDEEWSKIRLVLNGNDNKEAFIEEWQYSFTGYFSFGDQTAEKRLWDDIKMKLYDWTTYEDATDEEIWEEFQTELCEAENKIRQLFGLETVDSPTYPPDPSTLFTKTDSKEDTTDELISDEQENVIEENKVETNEENEEIIIEETEKKDEVIENPEKDIQEDMDNNSSEEKTEEAENKEEKDSEITMEDSSLENEQTEEIPLEENTNEEIVGEEE